MALMVGPGPFGHNPAARFNVELPDRESMFFLQPSPKWVRAKLGGETIADTRQASLLYRHGALPVYMVPAGDLADGALAREEGTEDAEQRGTARVWTVRAVRRSARAPGARTTIPFSAASW